MKPHPKLTIFFWFPHNTHTFPPFQFTRFYLHNISSVTPQARRKLENEQAFMRFESMKQRKMCIMHSFTPSFDVRVSKFDQVIVVRTSFLRLIKILFYLSIYFVHTFMFCKLAPAERKPRKSNKVASPSKTATF